jgi:hypothetical protein
LLRLWSRVSFETEGKRDELTDCINVRRHFQAVLVSVGFQSLVVINRQEAERVDRDQDVTDIGVNISILESFLEVIVDGIVGDGR